MIPVNNAMKVSVEIFLIEKNKVKNYDNDARARLAILPKYNKFLSAELHIE